MDAECGAAPPVPPSTRAWIAFWIAAGCALRLTGLGVHSLWFDEVSYVYLSSAPSVADALRGSRYPPLGCYAVRFWMGLFGESDVALRALPSLVSCATLLLFARLAWLWCPVRARASAVALFAASPFLIWYGQEIAPYSFVAFGSLLALNAVAQVLASGRVTPLTWSLAAVGMTISMGSHYMGVLIGASIVALAAAGWRSTRLDFRHAAILATAPVAGGLVWVPWLLTVFPDQSNTAWGNIAQNSPRDLAELPVRLVVAFSGAIAERWPRLPKIGSIYVHEIAFAVLIWGGIALQAVAWWRGRRERDLWILIALFAPIAGGLALIVKFPPNFAPKYVTASAPAVAMAVACGFASLSARAARVALVGATIAFCLWLSGVHKLGNFREDYRGVCAEIAAAWKPGDAIVAVTGTPEPFNQSGLRHYFHDRPELLAAIRDTTDTVAKLPASLPAGERVHVLYRISDYAAPGMKKLREVCRVEKEMPPRYRVQYVLLEAGKRP